VGRSADGPADSSMKYVSQFDVLQIRTRLQATTRSSYDLMNPAGLHAALAAPRQVVFGQEMHPGIAGKAAILFTRLIQNHPFYDGNKRIALEALRLFLHRNQRRLTAADAEALQFARRITLEPVEFDEVTVWIEQNMAD
jgi:death on curing protein